jgi:peptidoglycan/xylan/chitin deacetylase (PgdA/CDA1 family)
LSGNRPTSWHNVCIPVTITAAIVFLTVSCTNTNQKDFSSPSKQAAELNANSQPSPFSGSSSHPVDGVGSTPDSRLMQQKETGTPPVPAGKTIYLTFDDGPSESTVRILDILRNYRVKATFFVIGNTAEEGKELYRRIVSEGHALGNHTFSHDYRKIYASPEAFKQDVERLSLLLEETIGRKPDILRFPGGSNNKLSWRYGGKGIMGRIVKAMQEEGYQYFDWNVSSTDAAVTVQEKDVIISSVLSASANKKQAIVLMHDNSKKTTTLEALPVIIEKLKNMGYTFDVLHKTSFTFQFLTP